MDMNTPHSHGYVCFYNSQRIEVYAEALYQAKVLACLKMKVPKSKQHMVTVMLAEKDGEQVTHNPTSL